jgi:hypothetical protein
MSAAATAALTAPTAYLLTNYAHAVTVVAAAVILGNIVRYARIWWRQ